MKEVEQIYKVSFFEDMNQTKVCMVRSELNEQDGTLRPLSWETISLDGKKTMDEVKAEIQSRIGNPDIQVVCNLTGDEPADEAMRDPMYKPESFIVNNETGATTESETDVEDVEKIINN